jgi:hypothetical protein
MTSQPTDNERRQNQPTLAHSYRRLLYATLSAVVPGTGQWIAGRRRRGGVMLALFLVIVAGIALFASQGSSGMLYYLVQPSVLLTIFLVNIAVLIFRLFAIVDAYARGRTSAASPGKPTVLQRAIIITGMTVILTVAAAPHAVVGYYAYITHDMLTHVFSAPSITQVQPTQTPAREFSVATEPTPTPMPDSTPTPTPEPMTNTETTPALEPTPTPEARANDSSDDDG